MKVLTIAETAVRLKVSPAMARRFVKEHKEFLCVGIGKKSTRIMADRLETLVYDNVGKRITIAPVKAKKPTTTPVVI